LSASKEKKYIVMPHNINNMKRNGLVSTVQKINFVHGWCFGVAGPKEQNEVFATAESTAPPPLSWASSIICRPSQKRGRCGQEKLKVLRRGYFYLLFV
jgi:hypothetical protein